MKAFEEWWLMEGQNIVGHYDQQERYLAHDVWRAALEWAYNYPYSEDETMGNDDITSFDIIERELSGDE